MSRNALKWSSASLTHTGKVRKINEDAVLELPQRGLWAVADGMGGHEAGDVASRMIVDSLREVADHDRPSALIDDVEDRLCAVNDRLHGIASESEQPMTIGSTVVVLLALEGHAACLWAGDSRVYRLRNDEITQVTRDHSQVEELVEQGELLPEDAETHPLANVITRAVGGSAELFVDMLLDSVEPGDRYLLCSDGLYKDLTRDDIRSCLADGNCAQACRSLVDLVLDREAADNVSVAIIDFEAAA